MKFRLPLASRPQSRSLSFARMLSVAGLCVLAGSAVAADSEVHWRAGFAKVDVTPTEPVRMAGYGSRDHASEGIDTPLFVRCVALRRTDEATPLVLLSVDTIGLPGSMTREMAEVLEQRHDLPRSRVVFCSTHTHCGPDLVSELSNIFAETAERSRA